MKKILSEREVGILCSYQWASEEHVFPNLRLVSITLTDYPELYFYVNGRLSEDDQESLSLIITYFGTQSRFNLKLGYYDMIQVDASAPIVNYLGVCVYARKEEKILVENKPEVLLDPGVDMWSKVNFFLQQAMINNTFSEIRNVFCKWGDDFLHLFFIVDGELSKESKYSLECIGNEFFAHFPSIKTHDTQIIRIDFPLHVTENYGATLIYCRKEHSDLQPSQPYLGKEFSPGWPSYPRGEPWEVGYREDVDFKETIGIWKSEDGLISKPTTRGRIHYDTKGGAHIIPIQSNE